MLAEAKCSLKHTQLTSCSRNWQKGSFGRKWTHTPDLEHSWVTSQSSSLSVGPSSSSSSPECLLMQELSPQVKHFFLLFSAPSTIWLVKQIAPCSCSTICLPSWESCIAAATTVAQFPLTAVFLLKHHKDGCSTHKWQFNQTPIQHVCSEGPFYVDSKWWWCGTICCYSSKCLSKNLCSGLCKYLKNIYNTFNKHLFIFLIWKVIFSMSKFAGEPSDEAYVWRSVQLLHPVDF